MLMESHTGSCSWRMSNESHLFELLSFFIVLLIIIFSETKRLEVYNYFNLLLLLFQEGNECILFRTCQRSPDSETFQHL